MLLTLQRIGRTAGATFGQLVLGQQILAITLEDPPDEGKGPIPAGTYGIELTYSARFQALLPEVRDVPGFTGIRIHAGNTSADTTGCILVGTYRAGDHEIGQSRLALGRLLDRWPDWVGDRIMIMDVPRGE